MSQYKDNSHKSDAWRFPQTLQNDSIYSFIRNIEKHFFAEVTVQNCTYSESAVDLAIQLECNLTLFEVLNHANMGTWGNFKQNQNSPLPKALKELKNENNIEIRIDEFSIFLKDTSVIIKRTNHLNISEQLESILREISAHYIYFTKGLSQKPYEIYIPVLEEEEFNLNTNTNTQSTTKNCSEYWGIYFESEDDAIIYDVKQSSYLPAELRLCMADV
ncbi:hypothetical protein [uncultured Maribacter sp.]|uniref:hypothetical protein n=1 Tax=uncultured Maribacter sp. TaxID=431308 RepID=UPI00262017E4|nr:hypothetical protein [uncultured Maribacter sp.]